MTDDWYGPETATFGDRLAAAREATGLDQAELARRLGVEYETLQGWEDDSDAPRANRLSMLAGMLNVSIPWLLTGEGEGIDSPEEQARPDMTGLLAEMRALRTDMMAKAEAMGRLEKRLRKALREPVDA